LLNPTYTIERRLAKKKISNPLPSSRSWENTVRALKLVPLRGIKNGKGKMLIE